jgi:hypothetical protein
MHRLISENEIMCYKEYNKTDSSINSPTYRIPIGLGGQKLPKYWIKEVNKA